MHNSIRHRGCAVALGLWATCSAGSALAQPAYKVTRLGDLGPDINGQITVVPYAVNASGLAGGIASFQYPGHELPVLWPAGGTAPVVLDYLGAKDYIASGASVNAINAGGVAVGYSSLFPTAGLNLGERAVRWAAGGTAVVQLGDLGLRNGATYSVANAIDSAGNAFGHATKNVNGVDLGFRAVRWDAGQTAATELTTLNISPSGVAQSNVRGANDSGQLVGEATTFLNGVQQGRRPVRWTSGGSTITELPTLGVNNPGQDLGFATSINQNGTSAGYLFTYVGNNFMGYRALKWSADGTQATELLPPADATGDFTRAYAMNRAGDVVGDGWGALIWRAGDTTGVNLNTLIDPNSGWQLGTALGINDDGVIVGIGNYDPDGPGPLPAQSYSPFRLDPVPEPALLPAVIVMSLCLTRRRRRL
jgi:hypothetical protein